MRRTARQKLTLAALLVMAAGIVLVVALPNTALAWLRSEYRWLGQSVNWVEALSPELDTVHILLFAVFGAMAQLALPKVGVPKLMLGITAFSGASEILQFWAPGRTARLSDFAQDVLGALAGVFFIWALHAIWRLMSPNTPA